MKYNNLLQPSVIALSLLSFGNTAMAQNLQNEQTEADSNDIQEVVVTGVRYSLSQAIDVKRDSMQIVDAIVAEDLGKFPDNNVVESMQRIPGVQTTDRGGGEVSGVSIRGLSDVTTTINGRNIFTDSGRSVALQDIPSTLINRVDVYKTRSPENISRGIAGQIDVHTNRPFDFDGLKVAAVLRGIRQEQAEKNDPQASLLVSNRWDLDNAGEFGALVNVAYTRTNYRDMGANAGASFPFEPLDGTTPLRQIPPSEGWTPGLDRGLPTAPGSTLNMNPDQEFLHWRDAMFNFDFRGERERPAANIALQWAPNDRSEYTYETFYTGYRVDVYNSLWFQFLNGAYDPNDPVEIYPDTNVIKSRTMTDGFSFTSGDISKDRTDSYLHALRGEWQVGDALTLESEVVYQESDFETDFWGQRLARVAPEFFIDINGGGGVPSLDYDPSGSGSAATDPADPSNYWLDWAFDSGERRSGDASTWTVDGDYDFDLGWINKISFGVRWDNRSAEVRTNVLEAGGPQNNPETDAPYALADLEGIATAGTDEFFNGRSGVVQSWAVADESYVRSNVDFLRSTVYGFNAPVYDPTFEIDETQKAFYVQADFATEFGNGSVLDGRFGFRWLDVETDISAPGADGQFVDATNASDTILPSLMVRWGITEDLMARLSYTETFNLPTFADLNPYIQYFPDVTDIGYGTATGGNPDLDPVESENLDISLEWYFAKDSVLYATWFKRDITNFITPFRNAVVVDVPNDVPDRGPYTYILSQPDNAGEGQLDGWEFGVTWFPELEGWLNGFGIQASYTLLDSEQELPILDQLGNVTGTDTVSIGGVSDSSYSAILAYDRGAFSGRLSYFWREDFYNNNEAALFANPLQVWRGEEESLDLQFSWDVNDQWTLTFDATNLTEPTYHWNYGDEPELFNFHNYIYSRTFALGVRFSM